MTTTIILVRHGETEWNRIERFRGQFDIPLNATGVAQAEKTSQEVANRWKPAVVYTSPLSRAVQTAERIAVACGVQVEPVDELTDIKYGAWQGLTVEEAHEKWPALVDQWFKGSGTVPIPGGETLNTVQSRALSIIKEICERHSQQQIVIVAHTVVNRAMLLGILKIDYEQFWHIGQDPCALNLIEKRLDHYIVHSINCVGHLVDGYQHA